MKNYQALLSTPNDNYKANNSICNSSADTDEPDSKDYSNHSSSNYERKKNMQNSSRKPYMGGGGSGVAGGGGNTHRGGNPNIGGGHHNNSNPIPVNSNTSSAQNPSIRKGPLIHHPVSESSGNSHVYSSGAIHHHTEHSPPHAYNRVISTPNSKFNHSSYELLCCFFSTILI